MAEFQCPFERFVPPQRDTVSVCSTPLLSLNVGKQVERSAESVGLPLAGLILQ